MRLELLLLPLLLVTVFITVPLFLSITISSGNFIDGLWIPLTMQATREAPAYWIFGVGMSICCVLLVVIGIASRRWMLAVGASIPLAPGAAVPILCGRCSVMYERTCQLVQWFFCLSGCFFALTAWSNHMFFHRRQILVIHEISTVAAYAAAVAAMNVSHFVNNHLVALLKTSACSSAPAALRTALLRSKRWKTVATYVINVTMLMHMPTAYVYLWFCSSGGGIPPEGAVFSTFSACLEELNFSEEYCESWRDIHNATMTRLYTPPADVCPSLTLAAYNAITQYLSIATLTLYVCTLQCDYLHVPVASHSVSQAPVLQHATVSTTSSTSEVEKMEAI